MKRLLLLLLVAAIAVFALPKSRAAILGFLDRNLAPTLASIPLDALKGKVQSLIGKSGPSGVDLPSGRGMRDGAKTWTFADGSQIDAVLVAADSENAQLRVIQTQGVCAVPMKIFAEADRGRIESWVSSKGSNGVAGFPLQLKTHRWPEQWRGAERVDVVRIGETDLWKSAHFEITDHSGLNRESIEAIARICESVDGALSSLPLPLPVNWGRPQGEQRKILVERKSPFPGMEGVAGFWDPKTGLVHVFSDHLIEPDLQLVVFEFDKPEKVQKYDVIVHEVTHQSTAALIYLGAPAWVPEGLAEYMAATQYAPAFYQFTNTHVSLKYHINKLLLGDRIVKDRRMNLVHLETLMNRDIRQWNMVAATAMDAGRLQYDESLLLIDYFVHRDHPEGAHFRRYLECILSGVPEKEARQLHLLRGRTYQELEQELVKFWRPLGLTIQFQDRGQLSAGDVTIDWAAEDVKRTIASKRAQESAQ